MPSDRIKISGSHTTTGGYHLSIEIMHEMVFQMTLEAMAELSREISKKIAGDVFKKHKKKIMDGVNVDLIVQEVEKNLLEKIKKHSDRHRQ